MAESTIIAWTNHTFNIAWGCVKVSAGCANCYANTLASRYGHDVWGHGTPRRTFGPKHWGEPLKWNSEAAIAGECRRVFCGSMCDWAEDHPQIETERTKLWSLIRRTPWLHWLLLTKRAERIKKCLPDDWGNGYPNVWLGTSIEDIRVSSRADYLKRIPAAVRFVSYEPALGPLNRMNLDGIDWVIFGGESGPGYRAPDGWLDWARDMRDRCLSAGVAYFFKQSPAHRTEIGTTLDGKTVREYPTPRKTECWSSRSTPEREVLCLT